LNEQIWNDFVETAKNAELKICFLEVNVTVAVSIQLLVLAGLERCATVGLIASILSISCISRTLHRSQTPANWANTHGSLALQAVRVFKEKQVATFTIIGGHR